MKEITAYNLHELEPLLPHVKEVQFLECTLPLEKLSGIIFEGCIFLGSKFTGSNLTPVSFLNGHFEQCTFDETHLKTVNVQGSHFLSTSFRQAKLEGCRFDLCSFDQADFRTAQILQTTFSNSAVLRSQLDYAEITNSCFAKVDLSNEQNSAPYAKFHGTHLVDCRYHSSLLDASLTETKDSLIYKAPQYVPPKKEEPKKEKPNVAKQAAQKAAAPQAKSKPVPKNEERRPSRDEKTKEAAPSGSSRFSFIPMPSSETDETEK